MASKAADWLLARHAAADAEVAEDIAAGLGLGAALEPGIDPKPRADLGPDADGLTQPDSRADAGRAVS
jgi:hypothetical protein